MSLMVRAAAHTFALHTVLQDVALSVGPGQTVALVGPSGCGKTTLLHLCAGLVTLQEGRIDNSFERTAVVFQQPRLLLWKTVRDNIALGLKAQGLARRDRLAQAA